jgi:hypothetical protein
MTMGTRGAIGIRIDGQDKVAYNHFDSYPEGLGVDAVEFIREWLADGRDKMRDAARSITLIDEDIPPTQAQKDRLAPVADLGVSEQSLDDWYCLTRHLQGDLGGYLKYGVMPDGHVFMQDSLFCEWAYVVNLDDFSFEVYRGFQKEQHSNGRYAALASLPERRAGEYWPVALVKAFALDNIPQNWIVQVDPPEDEDQEG